MYKDLTKLLLIKFTPSFGLPKANVLLVMVFASLSFSVLFLISFSLQALSGAESAVIARNNLVRGVQVVPARGLFYDRNQERLVVNKASYNFVVNKELLTDSEVDLVVATLTEATGEESEELRGLYEESEGLVTLVSSLNSEEVIQIESKLGELEELEFVQTNTRQYLKPKAFSHIVGYTGGVNQVDINNGYGYQDQIGKSGLESVLEDQLKGVKGRKLDYIGVEEVLQAVPGNSIFLTIDAKWQQTLYGILGKQVDSLGARAGAVAIMDISNGDILSYVSYPTYNPNDFSNGISNEQLEKYSKSKRRPLVDKVIGLQASPGSTFKIVSAYANLELGTIKEETSLLSTGCMKLGDSQFCEFGKYYLGQLNIVSALSRSSNTFFCHNSLKLVNKHGYEAYRHIAEQLGVGSKTGIGLSGELSGVLPSPEYKLEVFNERWYGGDTCNTVIGQGMVLTTPLQMLSVVATIANGGIRNTPNLILRIEDQQGVQISRETESSSLDIEANPKTIDLILRGMRQAVISQQGTGYQVLNGSYGNLRVKTGSAEATESIEGKIRTGVHGWVIGTFEHEKRTYAFVVHINFGGGGWNTTPVIKKFMHCLGNNFKTRCANV